MFVFVLGGVLYILFPILNKTEFYLLLLMQAFEPAKQYSPF